MNTIFLDIDGCLLLQESPLPFQITCNNLPMEALPGALTKIQEWHDKGYKIILVTGRKECMYDFTVKQLQEFGIINYDKLIMDCGNGKRIMINDLKPYSDDATAQAICLQRNIGIANLNI